LNGSPSIKIERTNSIPQTILQLTPRTLAIAPNAALPSRAKRTSTLDWRQKESDAVEKESGGRPQIARALRRPHEPQFSGGRTAGLRRWSSTGWRCPKLANPNSMQWAAPQVSGSPAPPWTSWWPVMVAAVPYLGACPSRWLRCPILVPDSIVNECLCAVFVFRLENGSVQVCLKFL
jgi:hypothetical protein